jgi:UDP-4-amino-4,6-dideoxy-N-acetyl-beta-L-altrosamine N-acetyltransferase
MYRDDPIEFGEHTIWFTRIFQDTEQSRYRVVEWNSKPVGLVSLTKIDSRHRTCEWGGYIGSEIERGLGVGKEMLRQSLDMAFTELKVNRVSVEVLVSNHRAIKIYESIGFIREGILRERAIHASGPKDALLLSMLGSEWELCQRT